MQKKQIGIFLTLVSILLSPFWVDASDYSIINALDYYGFKSVNQKKAIESLFQRSSLIAEGQSLEDAFPNRDNKEQLVLDLLKILKAIQNRFVVRSGPQERWEVKALSWMTNNKEQTLADLKTLGFVDATIPQQQNVDTLCILGASNPSMLKRIKYANFLIQSGLKVKSIILLAGERYATVGVDGTEEQLSQIAKSFNMTDWRKITETHLIKNLYHHSELGNRNLPVYVIDTPKHDLLRPTTQTTILELLSWLKNHDEIKKIVFVSNEPYVRYQNSIIQLLFKEKKTSIKNEVVGNAVTDFNSLQPILEGFGSYIWAALPMVLLDMNLMVHSLEIKQTLQELYSKNPLIYQAFPLTLRE